jgi:hypothetical protein
MELIVKALNCGHIYKKRNTVDFYVSSFKDIMNIIIPFFDKYPLRGIKILDYKDFYKVALLMKKKQHITAEGLILIKKIKDGMNTKRVNNSS